jgi:hypothetical protein
LIILISSLLLSYLTFSIKEKKKKKASEIENKYFPIYSDDNNDDNNDDCDKLTLDLIRSDQLELSNVLGKGAFGTVYEGYYSFLPEKDKLKIAIKVLNNIKVDDEVSHKKLNDEFLNVFTIIFLVFLTFHSFN